MNPEERKRLIRRFFQALPEAGYKNIEEVDKYYVDRRLGEISADPIEELLQQLTMALSAGAYLFSGLRGSGKTTELVRLRKKLEADGCVVFYTDMDDYLNLREPLGLEDTLVAMLGALSDCFDEKFGVDQSRESYWDRLARVLKSEVVIEGWNVKASGVELKGSLKTVSSFRQKLRSGLNNIADAFLPQARAYADELVRSARRHAAVSDDVPVVLLVDSLERVSAATGDETKMFDGLKDLFFNQRDKLRFATLTTIYSVPPYLDAVIPGVAVGFSGGKTFGLPHFKVLAKQNAERRHEEGIDLMVEVVGKRFGDWPKVVDRAHLAELAFQSGGNIRRFFNLARDLLVKLQLTPDEPLPLAAGNGQLVQKVLSAARDPYQWLSNDDRRCLAAVAVNNQPPLDKIATDLPVVLRLFDTSLILDYRNGERWYHVLPLVRPLLEEFEPVVGAAAADA